jgi:hypothetical protein
MILYVCVRPASSEVVDHTDPEIPTLQCATVVLKHPGGSVGFEGGGDDVIKAIVHDVVAIERANSPGWMQLQADAVSRRALHSQFTSTVTCSAPLPGVLQELEAVSANKLQAKKNIILARHGKSQKPLPRTLFDDWIASNAAFTERSAQWLIDSCQTFALWQFSAWGWDTYALILARTREAALEPVLQAGEALHLPVKRVTSTRELPVW